jgi:hypothetical protein
VPEVQQIEFGFSRGGTVFFPSDFFRNLFSRAD